MNTIEGLKELSSEDQSTILSFLHDTIFSETYNEAEDGEVLHPEFYPIIVKYAESLDNSIRKMCIKLLRWALVNSSEENRELLVNSGAITVLKISLTSNDPEIVMEGVNAMNDILLSNVIRAKYILVMDNIMFLLINILTDFPDANLVISTLDLLIFFVRCY